MKDVRPGGAAAGVPVLIAVFILSMFLPAKSGAEGIFGYMEHGFTRASTESRDATGTESRSDSDNFVQRYNISIDKRLYPNLRLFSGGLFEKNDLGGSVETGAVKQEFDSSTTKLRPYVDVNLSTPLYQVGAGYSRGEDRQKSQGSPALTLIRDQYSGTIGWNPDGFPSLRLQYLRSDSHDGERVLQDQTTQTYHLASQYRPAAPLLLQYEGIQSTSEDRRNNSEIRDRGHDARVSYADQFWNRRISIGSDYRINHREIETRAGGAGEVSVQLLPLSGLSAIDDTPEEGALASNPAIVDGNLQAGIGINIGLPPPGGDSRRRNIGLDFGFSTSVNTLLVWIDRELPGPIANSFSWDIYTSSDNLNWVLRQAFAPAVLDPFVPRFEIRFVNVTTRFIKVVTRPLAPTVPLAGDFPLILITELQAALRSQADAVQGKITSTTHIYNFHSRTRILDSPNLAHELTYFFAKTTGDSPRYSLSNGLFAGHPISRNVYSNIRIAREDNEEENRKRTSYLYSFSLNATPLPTLQNNLVFSGRSETTEGRSNRGFALFLYNTAALYRGIDANVAIGGSSSVNETGQKTVSVQADAGASIVPNRKVTINLTYSEKRDTISGGALPSELTATSRSMQADIAVYPVSTVYLFGSYRAEETSGFGRRNTKNYSASWTPFPDGRLHLSFLYSETLRSGASGRDRAIRPGLRLDLGKGSFLAFAYNIASSRDNFQSSDTDSVSGNLRIAF